MIYSKSGGYMGIGFAIPSNMAKYVKDQIIKNGSVKRGYIGIAFQNIDKEYLFSDTLQGRGMLIPARAFKEIGLFDDKKLPQYYADEDFSLRAKKNGYSLVVSCKSIVISDTKNTGYDVTYNETNFAGFIRSHFTRRSFRNIKCRFRMALKHITPMYLSMYLLLDETRLIGSFFRSKINER